MLAFALVSSMVNNAQTRSEPSKYHTDVIAAVKNHPIPAEYSDNVIKASLPFFDLPMEEKMKYDLHASTSFKGYNALLSENTDPEGRGDLNEGFNIGWEPLEGDESQGISWDYQGTMGGENVWPQGGPEMKEFRRAMLQY